MSDNHGMTQKDVAQTNMRAFAIRSAQAIVKGLALKNMSTKSFVLVVLDEPGMDQFEHASCNLGQQELVDYCKAIVLAFDGKPEVSRVD